MRVHVCGPRMCARAGAYLRPAHFSCDDHARRGTVKTLVTHDMSYVTSSRQEPQREPSVRCHESSSELRMEGHKHLGH